MAGVLKSIDEMSVEELRAEVLTFRQFRQSFIGTQSGLSFPCYIATYPAELERAHVELRQERNELRSILHGIRREAQKGIEWRQEFETSKK